MVAVVMLALMAQATQSSQAPFVAAKGELDSAFAIVKHHALWRDTVSWKVVEPTIRAMAAGAQRPADVYPAITALLNRLGDHQSVLVEPGGLAALQTDNGQNPPPAVRVLPGATGIVIVPDFNAIEPDALRRYALALYGSLQVAMPHATCGWIVDLRGDGGGNMWPVLAGLHPFLGNAALGTFVTTAGAGGPWNAGQFVNVELPSALASLQSAYVAVLTGAQTAGAGEAVAIAFRGRPRTRSFGVATAGRSTETENYPLPDGAVIVLTDAVDADRMGTRYGGVVDPDDVVAGVAGGVGADPQIAAARAWLAKQPGCRTGG